MDRSGPPTAIPADGADPVLSSLAPPTRHHDHDDVEGADVNTSLLGTDGQANVPGTDDAPPAPDIRQIHLMSFEDVQAYLHTSPQGLSSAEVQRRLALYGPNDLKPPEGTPMWVRFLRHFYHPMAVLLWIAGVIGFAAGEPILGVAIWMVNLINGLFSFYQESKAETATKALSQMLPEFARVVRDGQEQRVSAKDLVVGDYVIFDEGDAICADSYLFEADALQIDESNFTGESQPVEKMDRPGNFEESKQLNRTQHKNLCFTATAVVAGTGRGIVISTGMNTEFGKLAAQTGSAERTESPLQREMLTATKVLSVLAVSFGITFFLLAYLYAKIPLAESFINSLGMVVAFIPEGMLPLVTLSLALGTQRMAKRNVIVKNLDSVETLGCTTVICSDKTGTLTQNELTVTEMWTGGNLVHVEGIGYNPNSGDFIQESTGTVLQPTDGSAARPANNNTAGAVDDTPSSLAKLRADLRAVLVGGVLCNNSALQSPEAAALAAGASSVSAADPVDAGGKSGDQQQQHGDGGEEGAPGGGGGGAAAAMAQKWSVIGDPTEAALLVAGAKYGLNLEIEKEQSPRIFQIPFTSARRRQATVHSIKDSTPLPARVVVYVKGAPKELLQRCTRVRWMGEDRPLDSEMQTTCFHAMEDIAARGLRVLAVAFRHLGDHFDAEHDAASLEENLTLLGLWGMLDPPRVQVPRAIAECHNAGIRVVMITGDDPITAEAIGRRIGLARGPTLRVIAGTQLAQMSDEVLKQMLQEDCIFARSLPEDKVRVVKTLQALDNVVAVTGDGVNDAPALKQADIGVAMGITGTNVARQAADMILTDDNFASLVHAVEEGRGAYANIRKFIAYILTSNIAEAVPFVLHILSRRRIPLALSVMQVLAVDLGTDMVPALALGADPPERGIMYRPPRRSDERLINSWILVRSFFFLGALQALICMVAFYTEYWTTGFAGQFLDLPTEGEQFRQAQTMALGAVVFAQIGNLFATRTERTSVFLTPPFNNMMIWLGILTELVFLVLLVYVPFMQYAFETTHIPFYPNWLLLFLWLPPLLIAEELRKLINYYCCGGREEQDLLRQKQAEGQDVLDTLHLRNKERASQRISAATAVKAAAMGSPAGMHANTPTAAVTNPAQAIPETSAMV